MDSFHPNWANFHCRDRRRRARREGDGLPLDTRLPATTSFYSCLGLLLLVSAIVISSGIAIQNALGEIFFALALLAAPAVFLAFPTWEAVKAHSSLSDNLRRSTNEELRKAFEAKLAIISVLFMVQGRYLRRIRLSGLPHVGPP